MRRQAVGVIFAALMLVLGRPDSAAAAIISFEAVDLSDVAAGEDLWQYRYSVRDEVFTENLAFEVLFDAALYSRLEDPPPPVNGGWDIIALQPDLSLPDVGRYSALALMDGASLAEVFTVSFVWLGGPGTAPGAQLFEINEFDPNSALLRTVATGQTEAATTTVPEPGTLALVIAGISLVSARRLRSRAREGCRS